MEGDLEQGTASDAAKMHAPLLVEELDKEDADDDNTQPTTVYTLFAGDGALKNVVWDKEHSEVKAEEEEKDGKNKKKNNTKRGKRKAGETFKKNIGKICEDKDGVEIALDIEEAEEEEVSKKTRRGRKQKDVGSGEEI